MFIKSFDDLEKIKSFDDLEKEYEGGLCHQLCLQLGFFYVSTLKQVLK